MRGAEVLLIVLVARETLCRAGAAKKHKNYKKENQLIPLVHFVVISLQPRRLPTGARPRRQQTRARRRVLPLHQPLPDWLRASLSAAACPTSNKRSLPIQWLRVETNSARAA